MLLMIPLILIAWIALSAFFLVSVCMMSSVANRTELLTEDQFLRRQRIENGPVEEVPAQPSAEVPTW
jgi:hypothetical protein